MSDRFFVNNLRDYEARLHDDASLDSPPCPATVSLPQTVDVAGVSRSATLPKPLFPESNKILAAAIALKNEVVQATWSKGLQVQDPTLYVGVLGTALLCFRSFEITRSLDDLTLCLQITDSCTASATSLKHCATFICGQAGIYALGAAAAKYRGDRQQMQNYLDLFNQVANVRALAIGPAEGGLGMPYELLYGRVGFLWACLFINKYIGHETISRKTTGPIVDAVLAAGRAGASHMSCPLMYQWHGTRYWGAAHGLAGIMHVLMHFPLTREDTEAVKGTLRYMIQNRFQTGNYPSSDGNVKDRLVQWCHGAAGIGMTMCKAAQVFPSDMEFREAAVNAGEIVWKRGLLRKVGLCHGVSGNAYMFLSLHRLTGIERHLHRAKSFASFLHENGLKLISSGQMHGGDHPYSLFEGLAGTSYLWLDMARPEDARFPGYEL